MHFEIALIVSLSPLLYFQLVAAKTTKEKIEDVEAKIKAIIEKSGVCHDKELAHDPTDNTLNPMFTNYCLHYDSTDGAKKRYVHAMIQHANLDEGATVDSGVRELLRPYYKECGCDEAGHIIGRQLGGAGEEYNLFVQNGDLNRGAWKTIETRIYNHINDNVGAHVEMEIAFEYVADFPNRQHNSHIMPSQRPITYYFSIKMLMADSSTKEALIGMLDNEDHSYVTMSDEKDGVREYIATKAIGEGSRGIRQCGLHD